MWQSWGEGRPRGWGPAELLEAQGEAGWMLDLEASTAVCWVKSMAHAGT